MYKLISATHTILFPKFNTHKEAVDYVIKNYKTGYFSIIKL